MSFLSRLFHRRKYSTRSKSSFSISFSSGKSRSALRYGTHAERTKKRRIVLIILGLFILITTLLVLFRSPYFQVEKITAKGDTTFTTESATALLVDFLGENIFLINTTKIEEAIYEQYPTIDNLSVARRLPDEIVIRASDFPVAWVLTRVGSGSVGRYLLNAAGFVSGSATSENAIGLPLLELHSDDDLSSKEAVLSVDILGNMFDFMENIESRFELGVLKYKILDVAREIHLLLSNNWTLRLMIDQDWDSALLNLAEALRGQDIAELDFEYVDLRVPDKIFFQER